MKWIKFLKDSDPHKSGELVSIEDAAAAKLVEAKSAEWADDAADEALLVFHPGFDDGAAGVKGQLSQRCSPR